MSISFDAASVYTSDFYKSSNQTAELETKLKSAAQKEADSEKLLEVCKEFEAYFVEQMFKAMKKMVPEDESSSTNEVDMFSDLMYQDMAKSATNRQDFGIAQKLYEQMKRNYGLE